MRCEIDYLVALNAPQRELPACGPSAQHRACQQPAIHDPDVVYLGGQAQLMDEVAGKMGQAAPFDIEERAHKNTGPHLLLSVALQMRGKHGALPLKLLAGS